MNRTRIFRLAAAWCLCVLLCAVPAAAYVDVAEEDPWAQAVDTAGRYGLMNGYTAERFEPSLAMSRAMFVTVLGRALGAPVSGYQGQSVFSDVPQSAWYAPYVAWAADTGIASGVGGGRFAPERTVTRQEAAVLLLRAYVEAGQGPVGAWSIRLDYTDLAEVAQWAYEGVSYCTLKGIMPGQDGRFEPQDALTRGDAVTVLTAFFNDVTDSLYAKAMADAVNADADEIQPLVTLTAEDPMTTWDEAGRVLLLTWHRNPEGYAEGGDAVLSEGEVWAFTDGEIRSWYAEKGADAASIELRLEQLIGLPRDAGYTHVSALWASPGDVKRPAYSVDAGSGDMKTYFAAGMDEQYLEWFNGNINWSYTESAYPWTRLGYTYDWSLYGGEYGLTEFIIAKDSTVTVEFTKTTREFADWLAQEPPAGAEPVQEPPAPEPAPEESPAPPAE